jgi:hypothetical protein
VLGRAPDELARCIRTAEFRALVRDRTRNFVGRDFIIGAVESQLAEPGFRSGYVVVSGEPGIGKTALAATLVERHGWVHHFNVAPANIRSVSDFMTNVCAQLIVRYDLPHDALPVSVERDSGFLLRLLDEAAANDSNKPVVVLLDALDEADDSGLSPANNRLLLPPILPDGAYFVLTTRPKQDYRLQVDSRRNLHLDDQDAHNLADVRAYIERFVDAHADPMAQRIAAWRVDREAFAQVLTERSEGNFMYIVRVLDDIRDGRITTSNIADVRALPSGLRDYYDRHWREMKAADPEHFTTVAEPVVCTLATIREPVAASVIAEWARIDIGDVRRVIEDWREYFDEEPGDPEPRYRVYHSSFLDFLAGKVDLATFHDRIGQSALDKIRW